MIFSIQLAPPADGVRAWRNGRAVSGIACLHIAMALGPSAIAAQSPDLDSLAAHAVANNPTVHVAAARVRAAQARIGPAGARSDPMLMAGILNLPYDNPGYSDDFTMNILRLTQNFPYPGKLRLAEQVARNEVAAAEAALGQARLDAIADTRTAYYELAFVRSARGIVEQNRIVLGGLISASEARYGVGTASLSDVLRARVDAARLGDVAASLSAEERAALARLNAVLSRPGAMPVPQATIPARIARLAVAESATQVRFSSAALGAAAADSPLLPLDSLVTLAVRNSPMLRSHEAEIAAQERRLALARKAHLPDFDVSLEYDHRPQYRDYVSMFVSIPLRLQRGRKQNQEVLGTRADLETVKAGHVSAVDSVRRRIATLASDVERERTQLALAIKAVLPQVRATMASTLAGYQAGRVDFPAVIDAQALVFNYETAYFRDLTDFAVTLAELERVVGAEVLR